MGLMVTTEPQMVRELSGEKTFDLKLEGGKAVV